MAYRNLVPTADDVQDLGRLNKRWKKGYINKLVSSSGVEKDVDTLIDGAALADLPDTVEGMVAGKADKEHTHVTTDITNLKAALDAKANLGSPLLTGTPKAPTAAKGVNSTQVATTEFVMREVTDAVGATAGHVHTIANVTGLQTALNAKANLASPALTGTPTAPTAATATNNTQIATTGFVKSQGFAPLASPALTGVPTAPTAATANNGTQIATTKYVKNQGYATLASPSFSGSPLAPTADVDDNSLQVANTKFVKSQGYLTAATTTPPTRKVNTTAPLAGGGALTADLTLSVGNGTTAAKGVVQLSSAVNSTSAALAATPAAVKVAYDLANTANTAVNTLKTTVAAKATITCGTADLTAGTSALTTGAVYLVYE